MVVHAEFGHETSAGHVVVCTCSAKKAIRWLTRCLKASVLEAILGLPTSTMRTAGDQEREGELGNFLVW